MVDNHIGLMVGQCATSHSVSLSPREQEVLALMVEGRTNKEIAGRLGVSVHTVKTHIGGIFNKLGANTRLQAAVSAFRRGLI